MHAAYALVVGAALLLPGSNWLIRAADLAYPVFVVLIMVATGNHFLFDVGVGAFVVVSPRPPRHCCFGVHHAWLAGAPPSR